MNKGSVAQLQQTSAAESQEAPTCRHHWVIDSPQGATSRGVCKICGAEKEFRNSAGDSLWESDGVPEAGGTRWSSPVVRSESAPDGSVVSYATWVDSSTDGESEA